MARSMRSLNARSRRRVAHLGVLCRHAVHHQSLGLDRLAAVGQLHGHRHHRVQVGRVLRLDEHASGADVGGVLEDEVLHVAEPHAEARLHAGEGAARIVERLARERHGADGGRRPRGRGALPALEHGRDAVAQRLGGVDELRPVSALRSRPPFAHEGRRFLRLRGARQVQLEGHPRSGFGWPQRADEHAVCAHLTRRGLHHRGAGSHPDGEDDRGSHRVILQIRRVPDEDPGAAQGTTSASSLGHSTKDPCRTVRRLR
jgi:hypothetical protein